MEINDKTHKNKSIVLWAKEIIICTLSIIFLGLASVLVVKSMLGNDPISVLYEGLGISTKINMGIAANLINCVLAVIVFFLEKKYIHIGTLIYTTILGSSITFWLGLYSIFNIPGTLAWRISMAVLGYLLAFISVSAFIAIDIGIDPWTAITMIISKKTKKTYGKVRMFVDTSALIIGYFLGGTVGVMTIISALVGGPVIQKISGLLDKVFCKMLKYSK